MGEQDTGVAASVNASHSVTTRPVVLSLTARGTHPGAVAACCSPPALQMIEKDGFEWVNEGKSVVMPKWGFVATEPDKFIKFKVNTRSARAENSATVCAAPGREAEGV